MAGHAALRPIFGRTHSQSDPGREVGVVVYISHCLTSILNTPSRRKAFKTLDGHTHVGCMGKKKPKKKVMYSSHHSGEFESYNLVLYEPVVQVENFQYRTLVLIGEWTTT